MKKTRTLKKGKTANKPYKELIKILKERDVKYVEMDLDMTEETYDLLVEYGKKNIIKDKQALLNWAFIDILTKSCEVESNAKQTN